MNRFIFALLAIVALATCSTAKSTDCSVQWFRVFVPGKMVYAWNCICNEGAKKVPYVYGGSRYTALDGSLTTLGQVRTAYNCFRYFYHKKDLLGLCKTNPGGFMTTSNPLLEKCTKYAEKKYPGTNGPPKYNRKYCKATFSQARQIGMDMIASIWICQCDQPQWQAKHDQTMPYVIDGRAPFAVPDTGKRPDVVDFMEKCSAPFKKPLQYYCGPHSPDYNQFSDLVRKVWSFCCFRANVEKDAGLDCDGIVANSRQQVPNVIPAVDQIFQ